MHVNHGPSQQNSKEKYKPWKLDATARYYTSHAKTMLPTRKSQRAVEIRYKWKKLAAKSSVVLQRPSRLRIDDDDYDGDEAPDSG